MINEGCKSNNIKLQENAYTFIGAFIKKSDKAFLEQQDPIIS